MKVRQNQIVSTTVTDPIPHRCSYNSDFGDFGDCGIIRIHCANFVVVGSNDDVDGPIAVSMVLGQMGCDCGCKQPGRAFEYLPTPHQARMLAQHLIEAADAVEAHATKNAGAFLDRIRNGRAR